MNLSFYHYLKGPRTFWGCGMTEWDMHRLRYMQPFPPIRFGCGFAGPMIEMMKMNMFMNVLDRGMNALTSLIRGERPTQYTQQSNYSSFYPYVNFSNYDGRGGYTQNWQDIPQYQPPSTPQNTTANLEDRLSQAQQTQEAANEVSQKAAPEAAQETLHNDGAVPPTNEAPPKVPPTGSRKVKVPEGWVKCNVDGFWKPHFKDAKSATAQQVYDAIVKDIGKNGKYELPKDLLQQIINANPSCFDGKNKIKNTFDLKKLDLPPYKLFEKKADASKKSLAADNPKTKIAAIKERNTNEYDVKERLEYTPKNYIEQSVQHPKTKTSNIIDSDAYLYINGKKYEIHSGTNTCDYYSLTSRSNWPGNNYKLINPNTGHFDSNNEWEFYLKDEKGDESLKMRSEAHGGKKYFVLICGNNRFSMDDVMAGNVPPDMINDNQNNPFALYNKK